jgi:hypothetical protein
MTVKNVPPAEPRVLGPDAPLDTRKDLTLRESGGQRWNLGPNPVRESRPQSRNSGFIQRQPESAFEHIAQPRTGWYGNTTITRRTGSSAGAIVRH